MKRTTIILLTLLALTSVSTLVAWAGSAHFIKNRTTASCTNTSNLEVCFKEAGLESGAVETVTVLGNGSADYQCINGGNKNPNAANKETVGGPISNSQTFAADQNGNITGCILLFPPGPGSFSCPPGQQLVGPTNVSFSNVSLVDQTSGAEASLGSTTFSCP
ncbi:MAG TPA: hypothetical protein VK208_12330 [Pyrinomonadaceae bacterium]|jgi:hypothetical protein|nr:hypothetical protein [Pyrinomonadaceae bacterium]